MTLNFFSRKSVKNYGRRFWKFDVSLGITRSCICLKNFRDPISCAEHAKLIFYKSQTGERITKCGNSITKWGKHNYK